jgi:hypothetical protein
MHDFQAGAAGAPARGMIGGSLVSAAAVSHHRRVHPRRALAPTLGDRP